MKRTRGFAHGVSVFVLSAACALPGIALGQNDEAQQNDGNNQDAAAQQAQEQERQTQAKERQKITLKVFELEHRTPQEMAQLLRLHSGQMMGQALPTQPPRPGAAQPRPAPRTTGYRGAAQATRIVAMEGEDAKFLFVRGPEDKVNEIEQLVESFDVSGGEIEKQKIGNVHLLPVRNGKAQQIHAVLGQLGLPTQMVQLGETALIAVHANEEDKDQVQQVEQVIDKLAETEDDQSSDENSQDDNE